MAHGAILSFSISNAGGDGQDLTFQSEVTNGEDDLTMTVYFDRQPRRRGRRSLGTRLTGAAAEVMLGAGCTFTGS